MTAIWWVRRDLRLEDNLTLQKALEHPPVIPVFILDPLLLRSAPESRLNFLYANLNQLDADLRKLGSQLIVRKGRPVEVLQRLMAETGAEQIYAEEDFTPYARLRSALVGSCLPLKLVQGQLGLHPLAGLKASGKPYRVFTPYKKNWLALRPKIKTIPAPARLEPPPDLETDRLPVGSSAAGFPAGEKAARNRLESFLEKGIDSYHLTRDRMDLDGTSSLSPYFRFGILGLRTALQRLLEELPDGGSLDSMEPGPGTWLNELLWREFYIQVMYHYPRTRTENFQSQYDRIPWLNQEQDFLAWKEGLTGYPIVDAGMRQLRETGWMHNRARMITASFLVKDLLIDWRWGENWFREKLLDGDLAVNVGSWQWVAGTGTDAAPYFRIFNPITQSRKFDPEGDYIRKWVPELAALDTKTVHAPWEKGESVPGYPQPIVDHKFARERVLIAYQAARSK